MLTELQEALADAHALAIAASAVALKVAERTPPGELVAEVVGMRRDAGETRARCAEAQERAGDELTDELLARVNTTKERASDLANAWFKAGTGPREAWSFLAMGEAAEVAVWRAVHVLAQQAGDRDVADLADWALPIQERHLETALAGSVRLAELADPTGPRAG